MGGVPTLRSGRGGYLLKSGWGGVPTFPGLDGGGTYLPRWGGYLGRYPPSPLHQNSIAWTGYAAVGMPLAC